MLLYATAIQTGLRSSELRSLTRGRLFLDVEQPYIVCKARSTKNVKDCKQYIQPALAAKLVKHISPKAPVAPVAIGPAVAVDMARLTVDELARLFAAVKAEIQRRHAQGPPGHGRGHDATAGN